LSSRRRFASDYSGRGGGEAGGRRIVIARTPGSRVSRGQLEFHIYSPGLASEEMLASAPEVRRMNDEWRRWHWGEGNKYVVEGGKALILINGVAATGS